MTLSLNFLENPAEKVASRLLGCILERELDGRIIRVKIVETEAYDETDAASHSFSGRTERTDIMFGKPGSMYVYFTYGMHYCCNVVTDREGIGSAVLIRAVEPLEGEDLMQELRHHSGVEISNGPAKLCQALSINKTFNGHHLTDAPLRLIAQPPLQKKGIIQTTRIGISKAKDMPRRFCIADNPYVSKRG